MNPGDFIDPALVDVGLFGDKDIPVPGSGGYDISSIVEVPLVDGRVAIVDSNGVIMGFK